MWFTTCWCEGRSGVGGDDRSPGQARRAVAESEGGFTRAYFDVSAIAPNQSYASFVRPLQSHAESLCHS